jgi:hypothetical protein
MTVFAARASESVKCDCPGTGKKAAPTRINGCYDGGIYARLRPKVLTSTALWCLLGAKMVGGGGTAFMSDPADERRRRNYFANQRQGRLIYKK